MSNRVIDLTKKDGHAVLSQVLGLFGEDRWKLHTAEILAELGLPPECGKLLSVHLDRYDIHPISIRIGERVARGYRREQFQHVIGPDNELLVEDFDLPAEEHFAPPPPPETTEQQSNPGTRAQWLYAIEGAGLVKIGYSTAPLNRLETCQTGSPVPLTLIALWRGTRWDEHQTHARFYRLRVHGEWFTKTPEIMGFLRPHLVDSIKCSGSEG